MEKANRGRANSAFNRYKPHSWECEFLLSALTRRLTPARGVFRSTAPAAAARGRWRGTGRDGAVLPGPRAAPERSAAGRAAAPGWAAMLGECGAVGSAGASLRGCRSRPDSRLPARRCRVFCWRSRVFFGSLFVFFSRKPRRCVSGLSARGAPLACSRSPVPSRVSQRRLL